MPLSALNSAGLKFIAHRGYARLYPENTMESVKAAVKAGARFVEVDVQLSRDVRPLLMHDASLKRLCGIRGKVWDYSLRALAKMNAGYPGRFKDKFKNAKAAPLKSLAAFLGRHAGVTAFIEVKTESLRRFGAAKTLDAVRKALGPAGRQCVLISFSFPFLAFARRRCRLRLGLVVTAWKQAFSPPTRALNPEYIFCDRWRLPLRGSLKLPKGKLCVYEIKDIKTAQRLLDRGASHIETMRVKEMLKAFAVRLPQ